MKFLHGYYILEAVTLSIAYWLSDIAIFLNGVNFFMRND